MRKFYWVLINLIFSLFIRHRLVYEVYLWVKLWHTRFNIRFCLSLYVCGGNLGHTFDSFVDTFSLGYFVWFQQCALFIFHGYLNSLNIDFVVVLKFLYQCRKSFIKPGFVPICFLFWANLLWDEKKGLKHPYCFWALKAKLLDYVFFFLLARLEDSWLLLWQNEWEEKCSLRP